MPFGPVHYMYMYVYILCRKKHIHVHVHMFLYLYAGNVYNIPLVIWLQKTFPQTNPLVYVTPTPEMSINPSRYVDTSGVVYLPYLTDWKDGRSDLATLVQVLCGVFAENVPVYSRRSQGWGPQPSQPPTSYQSPSRYM